MLTFGGLPAALRRVIERNLGLRKMAHLATSSLVTIPSSVTVWSVYQLEIVLQAKVVQIFYQNNQFQLVNKTV